MYCTALVEKVYSFLTYAFCCRILPVEFFVLFLGLKTMENFQMRQLNAYVESDSTFKILIYRGCCSATSCRSRLKHPFGWGSPCHLLHMNSCRYSNKKLGLLLPFITLNLSFAEFQLLSACCVWTFYLARLIGSCELKIIDKKKYHTIMSWRSKIRRNITQ